MPLSSKKSLSPGVYVGINIGALSVKIVTLEADRVASRVVPHHGLPLPVLEKVLADDPRGYDFVGVSGHLGHISEAAAIQRALAELDVDFDAVASLGGESFLVYFVADKQIATVLSHNKCAAGSGEFFVQQIGRMGLGMEEAVERASQGEVVPLASRCSVHCKSDITHKLNRREAVIEDILHTLHDSMADKVVALLERSGHPVERLLLIGGVSRNRALVSALRRKLPDSKVVVLEESPYIEALGAALLTRDEPQFESPQLTLRPMLGRLPPLARYRGRVHVIPPVARGGAPKTPVVLGVDAGSTTTKAILMDPWSRRVIVSDYRKTNGDPVKATRECLHALKASAGDQKVDLVATTGSARERRTSTPRWTPSSRSAGRTPSTFTCVTGFPSITR